MKSLGIMIQELYENMELGHLPVSDWERRFIYTNYNRSEKGKATPRLSPKVAEIIAELHRRYAIKIQVSLKGQGYSNPPEEPHS